MKSPLHPRIQKVVKKAVSKNLSRFDENRRFFTIFKFLFVTEAAEKTEDGNLIPSEMGMNYFMRLIGDEEQASKPIVRIASLYENGSTIEVSVHDHPTVFVFPGVEGRNSCLSNTEIRYPGNKLIRNE